jgi:hypothetical protein
MTGLPGSAPSHGPHNQGFLTFDILWRCGGAKIYNGV